ncbi:MAG: hypothetical protein AAF517_01840 [Planctomycetota bacterium]
MGQASGQRGPGFNEKVGFKRDKVKGNVTQGETVGTMKTEGEASPGEIALPTDGELRDEIRRLAQEMDKEPLPTHRREQILKFQRIVTGSGDSDAHDHDEGGESSEGAGDQ